MEKLRTCEATFALGTPATLVVISAAGVAVQLTYT